jgi:hypothetical protein
MGLLDFLATKSNQTASDSNQTDPSSAQSPFSDATYPIPATNPTTDPNDPTNLPSYNLNQYPNGGQRLTSNSFEPIQPTPSNQNPPDITQTGVNPNPIINSDPIINAFGVMQNNPGSDPSAYQPQDNILPGATPLDIDSLNAQLQNLQVTPDITIPQSNEQTTGEFSTVNNLDLTNSDLSATQPQLPSASLIQSDPIPSNINPISPSADNQPIQVNQTIMQPENDAVSNPAPTVEIGVTPVIPTATEPQTPVIDELPKLQTQDIQIEVSQPQPIQIAEQSMPAEQVFVKSDIPELAPVNNSANLITNPTDLQTTLPTNNEVANNPVPDGNLNISAVGALQTGLINESSEAKIQDEMKPKIEKEDEKIVIDKFNIIKSVGFLGLNTKTFGGLGVELRKLSKKLTEIEVNILIDSIKGYGPDIIGGIEELGGNKVTAAFLKPYYSTYSDEAELNSNIKDFITVIYSDGLERTKYFIKDCDAFIIPETSGFINLSTLFTLLSLQYLYFDHRKPVILIGQKWKQKLEQLKSTLGISEEQFKTISFAANYNEAITSLSSLDKELSAKDSKKTVKVIDNRDGESEISCMI